MYHVTFTNGRAEFNTVSLARAVEIGFIMAQTGEFFIWSRATNGADVLILHYCAWGIVS